MYGRRRIVVVLMITTLVMSGFTLLRADPLCYVWDDAWIWSEDNCGNTEWVLDAIVSVNTLYDNGSAISFGACTGGYTNCAGNYVSPSVAEGDAVFDDLTYNRFQYVADWQWTLDLWWSEHLECNPSQWGRMREVVHHDTYETAVFEGICDCCT